MLTLTILFLLISIGYYFFSKRYICDTQGWLFHTWEWTNQGVHSTSQCMHCRKTGPTIGLSDYY